MANTNGTFSLQLLIFHSDKILFKYSANCKNKNETFEEFVLKCLLNWDSPLRSELKLTIITNPNFFQLQKQDKIMYCCRNMDTIILTSKEDLAHYLNRAPPDNIIRISKEFQLLDKKGIRQTSQNSPNKLEALITTSPSVPTYVKEYLKENPNEFMTSNKFNSEHFSQFNELLRISQIKKIPLFDRDIIENIKQKQKKLN